MTRVIPVRVGKAAPRRTRLPLAALLLLAACTAEPDLVAEHLRLGDEALASGKYAPAMAAYAHARELAPTDARAQLGQMRARVGMMAESPARVPVEALEDVAHEAQVLLRVDKSREVACLTALGNVLARRGDFDGARAKLTEATKVDPTSAVAHAALGVLLASRRETLFDAKNELALALKSQPESATALAALGQIQLAEGDVRGAIERLQAAVKHGDDFGARMALGNALLQQGSNAEAVEHFQRAAALDPKSPEPLGPLGQALLGAGRLAEAERVLRAAMQVRADEPTTVAFGFTLARLKKSDEALGVFGQVLSQNGNAPSALFGAAVASEDLGRTQNALDYYRRVLGLPLDGPQRPLVAELQKEAQSRVAALSATTAPSASASASPKTKR
jgi:tetratricopeptide (TPR) repeat protein